MTKVIRAAVAGGMVAVSMIACSDPVSPKPDGSVYVLESVGGIAVADRANTNCGTIAESKLIFQNSGDDGIGVVTVRFQSTLREFSGNIPYILIGKSVVFGKDQAEPFRFGPIENPVVAELSRDGNTLEVSHSVCYPGYTGDYRDILVKLVYKKQPA